MTTVPTATPARPPRRPFGLNAIIVLQVLTVLVSGTALVLTGVAVWAAVVALQSDLTSAIQAAYDVSAYVILMLVFTFMVNLLCAIGLWRRQRWAWLLTMLQLGFFMLEDLYSYFTGAPAADYAWSMLLNVLMVFYLNQREVQAVFATRNRDDSSTYPADPLRLESRPTTQQQGGAPQ